MSSKNDEQPAVPVTDERDSPQETAASKYRRKQLERQIGPTQWLDVPPPVGADTLWRGLTRKGEARLLVVRATEAVREATDRLECSPDVAKWLGELIISTQLVRSTLNPEAHMQVYIRHDGAAGQLVVDAWETGGVRAYVKVPDAVQPLIGAGIMEVQRRQPGRNRAWQSAIQLEGDDASEFMMQYLLESEQILSFLRTEVSVVDGHIESAVGYLIQLMPEGTGDDLGRMTANLGNAGSLRAGMTADDPDGRAWAQGLMDGFFWDQCAREFLEYECRCSEDRVIHMLSTLPRADLEELASSHEALETTCDFCRTVYRIAPSRVAALLELPS